MTPDALRTLKVDPETMEVLARRSLLEGPPVSVTKDEPRRHTTAALVCLALAFGTGAVYGYKPPVPALPPPVRVHVVPMTLRAVELPEPIHEAPRALRKLSRAKHRSDGLVDPWLSKPLFKSPP